MGKGFLFNHMTEKTVCRAGRFRPYVLIGSWIGLDYYWDKEHKPEQQALRFTRDEHIADNGKHDQRRPDRQPDDTGQTVIEQRDRR